jgi:hypothetical protein
LAVAVPVTTPAETTLADQLAALRQDILDTADALERVLERIPEGPWPESMKVTAPRRRARRAKR